MGKTATARLHYDGQIHEGEALLETSEIIFRGERRIVLPLAKMQDVEARDGVLHARVNGKDAALELGSQAAQWADKIRNPKSVLQKIGIKSGQVVSVLQLDDESFVADLEKAGAEVNRGRAKKNSDVIIYGASSRNDLERLEKFKASLVANGALWIIRPKGVKEITEADTMAAGKAAGLVDVKVVRFSETHSAEKFVIPLKSR